MANLISFRIECMRIKLKKEKQAVGVVSHIFGWVTVLDGIVGI